MVKKILQKSGNLVSLEKWKPWHRVGARSVSCKCYCISTFLQTSLIPINRKRIRKRGILDV